MKYFVIVMLAVSLILSFGGCSGSGKTENSDTTTTANTEKTGEIPDFHYTKSLYVWDSTLNDYQGGYKLIEGLPWESYPEELPLIGGYIDFGLGSGWGFGSHLLLVFTKGGDDAQIANWYSQQLLAAGWVVTDFETSEEYGSTRFNLANDNWYGDFLIQSAEAAIGGYDGGMARSESDFEKTAVMVTLWPNN